VKSKNYKASHYAYYPASCYFLLGPNVLSLISLLVPMLNVVIHLNI